MSSKSVVDVAPFNAFSKKFYKALTKGHDTKFSSPLGCFYALGMLYNGSKNETRRVYAKALQLPKDLDEANKKFEVISDLLNNIQVAEMSVANKAYAANNLDILQNWVGRLESSFMASAENVDFSNSAEATAKINDWVKTATNEKIQKLYDNELDRNTRFVLLNAMYFKDTWRYAFDKENTKVLQYYYGHFEILIEIEMMHLDGVFLHADLKDLDAQVIVLPYKAGDVNMLIFLPNKKVGWTELANAVNELELQHFMSLVTEKPVKLVLPKFKCEITNHLIPQLLEIGLSVNGILGEDYSGITETEKLKVSDVIQKAVFEVDEEGTIAPSVTAVFFAEAAQSQEVVEFRCDHPFVFYLTHRENFVLFRGLFQQPPFP